jgi:hypothetical protein
MKSEKKVKAHYAGHFGHFHGIYINYIYGFNFGFHFGVWASYFDLHKVNNISYLFEK